VSETLSQKSDARGAVLVVALKTARYALRWGQQDLANASGVSKVTIARMEAGMISPRLSTLSALQLAMERSGASFALNEPAGGFTLRVAPKALERGPTPQEKAAPAPTAIEQIIQEAGGKVVARNAGHLRDGLGDTSESRTQISEPICEGERTG